MAGRYRIRTVSERTGVPAPTLRVWERRYGVPNPERTESSYRLYSERDVELVQRMRGLVEGGMAASEAARQALRETQAAAPQAEPSEGADSLVDDMLDALERFDIGRFEQLSRTALSLGNATAVFEQVFAPVLVEVGTRWAAGEMSVAQEHLASDIVERVIQPLIQLVQPSEGPLILLACFAEDQHVLPLYGASFRLTQWGYKTRFLGARTPPDALSEAVRHMRPALVGLSITVAQDGMDYGRLAEEYGEACQTTPWLVGGQAAEALTHEIEDAGGHVAAGPDTGLRKQIRALTRA